ncbi:MAG: BCCT family transporter [Bdellovibrionota bacterium]|nr:BCCT family transporter [Bdellovibrionota bacterium]
MSDKESQINKNVFGASAFFILIITAGASIWPKSFESFFSSIQQWLLHSTSWIYVLSVAIIAFIVLWLMLSRVGEIKLGPDHSLPEYTNISWFAMLFSAGMGIGLLFFGVAEPIMHFSSPPVGEAMSIESAREAMKITFFHWGFHAWAIYSLMAIILAYFCYRKDLPLLPRSAFYPFVGDRIYGKFGDMIDTFSIIGTMFGVATSLGFGVAQVNAGLNYLFDIPQSPAIQVGLIAIITAMATVSVVLGLDGGIKKLSNANLIIAVLLLIAVLILGGVGGLMRSYVQNVGAYIFDITYKTFNLYAYEKKDDWIGGWTLLYWGWWISWSPFVGMFIARISRGRTIREFLLGVIFVPTAFTFLWMTVFGNSAITLVLEKNATELVQVVNENVPVALFKFFEYFPFSSLLTGLGLILVVTFFVSSSDSGSLVIDTLASGGAEEPPVWQRVFWAVLEGVVAATLLLAGGLDALQTMTIASAFPMIFMILLGAFALIKSLRADYLLLNSVQNHSGTSFSTNGKIEGNWRERLNTVLSHPKKSQVLDFIKTQVKPSLEELAKEMNAKGLNVKVEEGEDYVQLAVKKGEFDDFKYGVKARTFSVPDYVPDDKDAYCRAEVFLLNGGQDYDVYGYANDQILADAITQYEKHFHFLHTMWSEKL